MGEKMTAAAHQARHRELHGMLDELVADWISETGKLPSGSTVMELMQWSADQMNHAEAVGGEPERQVLSRGINPARPVRLSKAGVSCPECLTTFDTVSAKTLICPKCRTLFAMATGAILGKVPL